MDVRLGDGTCIQLGIAGVQLIQQHLNVAAPVFDIGGIAHDVHIGGDGVQQDGLLGIGQLGLAGAHQGLGPANIGHGAAAPKKRFVQRGGRVCQIAVRLPMDGLIRDDVLKAFGAVYIEARPPTGIGFGDLLVGGAQICSRALDLRVGGIRDGKRLLERQTLRRQRKDEGQRHQSRSKQCGIGTAHLTDLQGISINSRRLPEEEVCG